MKNKSKNTNIILNLIVIILIGIIIISSAIGLYAWAKYKSAIDGKTDAQVAKWHFDLQGNKTETGEEKLLAFTRTDGYTKVAEDKVAPGTFGELPIIIDTTGTEVDLTYDLNVTITNYPKNMILKTPSNKVITPEVIGEGTEESPRVATIRAFKYVPHNTKDTNRIHNETITWNWAYESGKGDSLIENDKIDTKDAGKEIIISVSVIGTQVIEEPRLAEVVKVGDYVKYNAASGSGVGKSYTTDSSTTGATSGAEVTFSSSDTMTWKVMSVDEATGIVELMAEKPTSNRVTLRGKTGYKNAETILNDIGKVYGYGDGATGGRSITIEDVNKLENYTPADDKTTSYTYRSGTFINDDGTEVIATETNPVTKTYTASTDEKSTNHVYDYTTTNFGKKSFWLASRCIGLGSDICNFGVRFVDLNDVDYFRLFDSKNGYWYGDTKAVVPVVSLKSNIQTSGQDENGAWNLVV